MSRYLLFTFYLCISISCDINNSKADILEEVKNAKDIWENNSPQNYSFQFKTICFCAFTDEVRIVVESDSVIDVQDLTTNETIMVAIAGTEIVAAIHEFYPSSFYTINQFFDRLEVQIPVSDESTVDFDRLTGMPIKIYIDRTKEAIDDEITYHFSNLTIY